MAFAGTTEVVPFQDKRKLTQYWEAARPLWLRQFMLIFE
jgi:hypothetical protein